MKRLAFLLVACLLCTAQTSTTLNVDIVVTHGAAFRTTFTFVNLSGGTLPAGTPISFGQAFAYGDIPFGSHPLIQDASTHTALAGQQWDEISTWRENGGNSSWRHAVWAIWLPSSLASNATYQIEIVATSGTYSETSHQALSVLCSGGAAHDLKIHLTDVRNQDDTVRDSGDATFRLCDNIANAGRDAPEHTRAGNVYDEYIVKGLPVYATSGHKDPNLYVECTIDIFTQASDGTSPGDVRHVCQNINAWENVGPGSTGNPGNPGPAGFANDPQAISARVEMDDGSTNILDWSALDATITSASNPIVPAPGPGGCDSFPSAFCMFVNGSSGAAAWYESMETRVTCSGTCPGGLNNGQLYFVHPSGQVGSRTFATPASQYVSLQSVPYGNFTGLATPGIVNGSQGTGTTTFSTRMGIYHTQAWQMLDPTGQDNWAPFGSATRVTRKVYPAFTLAEQQYWESTGAVVPLNLAQTPTVSPGPQNAESIHYFPDAPGTVIGGGGVGDRPDLGIVNQYAAQAFIKTDETSWDLARLFSFNSPVHGINVLLNEATGHIPALNNGPPVGPGGNGIGNSYPVLGTPQPQTSDQGGPVGFLGTPTTGPGGFDIRYGAFEYGTALDHIPEFNGISYIIFGDRYWLDTMRWLGNAGYLQQRTGPGTELGMGYVRDNNAVFTDGNTYHYYGLMLQCCQERGSAWLRRGITIPAAWGSDGDPERRLFADMVQETDNYEPLYLTWLDGPGNTNYRSSMNVPDNQANSIAPQLFIATYGFDSEWLGLVLLHQPMASRWLTRYQRFLEGCMGGLPNAPVSYYCVDYEMGPAVHIANYAGGSINGGNLGPGMNGADASDFGDLPEASAYSIGPGGQITEIPLNMTPPAQIKNIVNWVDEGGTRTGVQIDQLGAGWYNVIGPTTYDGTNFIATFFIQCSAADHAAFPAQCPVAGQAFTSFTSFGQPFTGNLTNVYSRPSFDPGPGQGYRNLNYFMYANQMGNGLKIAGFNMAHEQADMTSRVGGNLFNFQTGPSWAWDNTVVIPGLPTAVNGIASNSDPTFAVLPSYNDAWANWKMAGLQPVGGIPNRSIQCGATVTPSGITPPATGDDASKINAAIAACTDGQVVQLGSGTFHLDAGESVVIYKGITLRGTGNCTASSIGANPTTTGTVPLCSTVITMDNGAWPTYAANECGTTTGVPPSGTAPGSFSACPFEFCGTICMQPSTGALTNFGWGGCLFPDNPTTGNCGVALTSDAAAGDTTINVTSTTNFSVGMWVMIDEDMQLVSAANPTGHGNANIEAAGDFLSTSGSPVTFRVGRPDTGCQGGVYGLCGSGSFPRLNHDIHLVTAKTPSTLTFDSPLTMAFRQSGSHDARVYWPQANGVNTPFLQQAGVENLTITRAVDGPVTMTMCAYCWVRNVEASYWIFGINLNYSARPQVTRSFIHDCVDCTNDGAEYPLGINSATTEALVDNNITLFGGKGMVGRSATAAVVAYNYEDWQRYSPNTTSDGFLDMSVNGSHNAGTHHFLFEGNRGSNCDNDNTHGNAFYHTYFRNHCAGLRTNFNDAANCGLLVSDTSGTSWQNCMAVGSNGPLRAFGPMSFDYWLAYVANVGGLTGVSTAGNGWAYFRCALGACGASSETNKTVYMAGWSNPDWMFGDQNLDGTNGTPFFFRNRNFDYVTNGIPSGENPAAGFAALLPSSFYLTSAPSYFTGANCNYPWPWVTPTAGSPIQSPSGSGCTAADALPAKARFAAGTPFVQP